MTSRIIHTLESEKALLAQRKLMANLSQRFVIDKKIENINLQIAKIRINEDLKSGMALKDICDKYSSELVRKIYGDNMDVLVASC